MMQRMIYRLEPIAEANDLNWDRAPSHGIVVVRADSPADARIIASQAEGDYLGTDAKPGDGVSTAFASAFRDDKLYTVIEDVSGYHPADGEREVLSGFTDDKLLRPSQPD